MLDGVGQPLAGVTLSPEGVATGDSTTWGGVESRIDPLAVTDDNGQFQISCTPGVDRVFATVKDGESRDVGWNSNPAEIIWCECRTESPFREPSDNRGSA